MIFLNESREDESQEEFFRCVQGETDWSWKSLKREFRLSHSESLFHLYQAKLQHSFFVASLILNIIFNVGAIISYTMSKYNDMNLCEYYFLVVVFMCVILVIILMVLVIFFYFIIIIITSISMLSHNVCCLSLNE